ncbi:hypothetical protein KX729_14135 [Rhizobium sp. XQZ8]|uniref:diacylglycerol/polyprenol kinase family protein n=1 Tax=Rhizobium populisoli TaxID=2859785 RepID=UPI001CA5B4C9|nr:hypothetical protein [Rhizobium populisoli]MBW6422593.1 hypothetical protein [Rhizobium populisoli]
MSESVPVNWWEIGLVPVVILAILALMATVRHVARSFALSAEMQRKIIHVAVGTSSLFFPLVFSSPLPVIVLIICALIVMFWLRWFGRQSGGLGDVLHSVKRASYGEIYLALSVAFLFLMSQGAPVLYVLPLLVITLSDTASALVGTSYGRMRFAVSDGSKSYEGVIAFFTVTWICGMIVLLLMSDTARLNVIVLSFLIAGFCALVEADSWRGLDNLFVPIGAHLLLARHIGTDPIMLLVVSAAFVIAVAVAIRYSARLGISRHAARAFTINLFLLLAVTSPINAVLPMIAIAAHVLARRNNPCRSKTPDLDLLAASTGVSLLWLFAGSALGTSVIVLFNITFVGVAVILAVLAVMGDGMSRRWLFALVAFLVVVGIVATGVIRANPVAVQWYDPIWPPVVAEIVIAVTGAFALRSWFAKWRAPKAFGIALILPVILFVVDGVLK